MTRGWGTLGKALALFRGAGIAGLAVMVCADGVWAREDVVLSLSLQAPSSPTLGEPVFAQLSLRNASTMPVTLDLGWNRLGNVTFSLTGPSHAALEGRPHADWTGGVGMQGTVTIAPGQEFVETVLLNRWVSLSAVGDYSGRAALSGTVSAGRPGSRVQVESEMFHFSVLPRDDAKLRSACAAMLQEAIRKRGFEQEDALWALALIKDPVAAPYLVEAIENLVFLRWLAGPALVAIGGLPAKQGLRELERVGDRETVAWAKAQLITLGP